MMVLRVILHFLAMTVGVLFIVAGEADDSPGLQGLGLILILVTLVRIFRHRVVRRAAKLADKGRAP
jgi:hypothetical protein